MLDETLRTMRRYVDFRMRELKYTRRPRAFWFRRWVCRHFGHRFMPSLGRPWWAFNQIVVLLRCEMCGVEKPGG